MKKQQVDQILSRMLTAHPNVSDLNLTPGKPLQVESSGKLTRVQMDPDFERLTPFQTEIIALNLIHNDRKLTETLLREGSCDLSYQLGTQARFRVNIFSRSGKYAIVLRKLETQIPTIEDLNLPAPFFKMSEEKNGIIFVTGGTGSGKSTSLAALLDRINDTQAVHVITLEDPIEYQHPQKQSTFNQRELGMDFDTFASGLRAALRQAPKVILVGEMRDRETVEIGLSAAETGHLVLSTLHTVDAGQTINRILGMFSSQEEKQIRVRLADTVRWVVAQRLLPKTGGGRVAAFEIMASNLRVRDTILNGESEGKTYNEIIMAGKPQGMVTFDEYIVSLFREGKIDESVAMAYASRKDMVGRGLDSIKSARGESTTQIDSLEIDRGYKGGPES
ncbi:type IV pilus twitching motility protein PilT [Desulfotignum phosphitoxidans]|uniref:Twitching motility protein PilT2 n=1 Tax=Desulfotignum phosphitoxidans DSM 13687 TaxID=1286635 RepID=S0G2Z7_9BACT|nr:PilT/PilU family type 4a pilus ATPase [Desulfotignum phosphitoxidans]EMS79834.1 twitching motility protein PilT2 [Desulfotignum phosphitoxidans DSM 13687]